MDRIETTEKRGRKRKTERTEDTVVRDSNKNRDNNETAENLDNNDINENSDINENVNYIKDAEDIGKVLSEEARRKMSELLRCGNERVELAAAKEIISAYSKEAEAESDDVRLEVVIKIV